MNDYVDWVIATVRAEMAARDWSEQEYAERSDIPYGTLRQWLKRRRGLPFSAVTRFAAGFGMDPAAFLTKVQEREAEGIGHDEEA